MRRGELSAAGALAALAALALGGCMRIYPDPELPDVVTEWSDFDCEPGAGVVVALVESETRARTEVTVPCTDLGVTFVDVARERYRVEAFLRDVSGEAINRSDAEIDLRNGIDERVYLYFGGTSTFRVAWDFAMGATCESLGADGLSLRFAATDTSLVFHQFTWCLATPYFGSVPDGTYTVVLTAYAMTSPVAMSPPSIAFDVVFPEVTDLGVLTLSP